MSVILLDVCDEKAIGHARVCSLPNDETACWVESVVIMKARRGLGLGKLLMKLLEDKISQLGYIKVCLSTRDKEFFYEKCGYVPTAPIANVGAHSKLLEKFSFFTNIGSADKATSQKAAKVQEKPTENNEQLVRASCHHATIFPPPPPPLLPANYATNGGEEVLSAKKLTYMCKCFS